MWEIGGTEHMRLDNGVLILKDPGADAGPGAASESSFIYHSNVGSTALCIGSNYESSGANIRFQNNTDVLMVVQGNTPSDTEVGIGTTSPERTLHVHQPGGAGATVRISGAGNVNRMCEVGYDSSDGAFLRGGSSGVTTLRFYVDNTSYVGAFYANGDFYTNDGTVHSLSDVRIKKDIADLSDGLEIVKQLKPRTFKYTEDSEMYNEKLKDEVRYGFVANEVEEVAPQYTETGKGKIAGQEVDDLKSLSTTKMIPMLVKAIQELSAEVESLKEKLNG
jgi:hypothetical protein